MFLRCMLVLLILGSGWGCRSLTSRSASNERSGTGREQWVDEQSDPWIQDTGALARREHNSEDVPDPLGLRKYFVSDKAREIERNLGIGP